MEFRDPYRRMGGTWRSKWEGFTKYTLASEIMEYLNVLEINRVSLMSSKYSERMNVMNDRSIL